MLKITFFYVGKVYAVRKINIAIGERGEVIMDERVIDFQNIFAHDCLNSLESSYEGLYVL